jgi:hypothetical protein
MPTTLKTPPSELALYLRTFIFSLLVFGAMYAYTSWLKIPNVLNKAVADTAIFVMGLSMLMSSICYFFNFLDRQIIYRKHLGLIGFGYGLAHVLLSFSALQALFKPETWEKNVAMPALTGLIAFGIFAIMASISNRRMAMFLGGKLWRFILRTGYIATIFVGAHVVLLKYGRWITWYQNGMETPPSTSLLITVWIAFVVIMRIVLWLALQRKKTPVAR